jgi:ABC-type branched-subunit amino acid transport system ATPase component
VSLLEIQDVTKAFGGLLAVRDVSMRVEEGSIVAVIGPNGAGKTSLFNVVTGFDWPTSGTIRFDGEDIGGLEPWQVARRGLVRTFQTPVGFPALTVWENLMVAGTKPKDESFITALTGGWKTSAQEAAQRSRQLLEDLRLWDSRDSIISDLPPGDVKLTDFARQLMFEPRMLLLDEPASGVDPSAIGRLADLIRRVRDQGVTVLVIDHNIGFVLDIADIVHVMALGEVIASGPPGEIVHDENVIEIYLGRHR